MQKSGPVFLIIGQTLFGKLRVQKRAYKTTKTHIHGLMEFLGLKMVSSVAIAMVSAGVSFTANILSGPAPLEVDFTSFSFHPDGSFVSWQWDFGDDSSSNDENPTHIYNSPGLFSVSLENNIL